MSSFYSRCWQCDIDLPRGMLYCSAECKRRYIAAHGEPTPVTPRTYYEEED